MNIASLYAHDVFINHVAQNGGLNFNNYEKRAKRIYDVNLRVLRLSILTVFTKQGSEKISGLKLPSHGISKMKRFCNSACLKGLKTACMNSKVTE